MTEAIAMDAMTKLIEDVNKKYEHLICNKTHKSYSVGFEQLSLCISCDEHDCKVIKKILKSKTQRRQGMTTEYDRD